MSKKKTNFALKALKNLKAKIKGEKQVSLFMKTTGHLINTAELLDSHHTYQVMVVMKGKGMPPITWGPEIIVKAMEEQRVPPFDYKKRYTMKVKVTKLPVPVETVVNQSGD